MVSPKMKFVSVDNYVNLLTDPVTVTIAENTLLYIVILVLSISCCPMCWLS